MLNQCDNCENTDINHMDNEQLVHVGEYPHDTIKCYCVVCGNDWVELGLAIEIIDDSVYTRTNNGVLEHKHKNNAYWHPITRFHQIKL